MRGLVRWLRLHYSLNSAVDATFLNLVNTLIFLWPRGNFSFKQEYTNSSSIITGLGAHISMLTGTGDKMRHSLCSEGSISQVNNHNMALSVVTEKVWILKAT